VDLNTDIYNSFGFRAGRASSAPPLGRRPTQSRYFR